MVIQFQHLQETLEWTYRILDSSLAQDKAKIKPECARAISFPAMLIAFDSYCLNATGGPSISSGLCLHEARVGLQPTIMRMLQPTTSVRLAAHWAPDRNLFTAFRRIWQEDRGGATSFSWRKVRVVDTLQTHLKKHRRLACNGRWMLIVLSIKEVWSQWVTKLWVFWSSNS